MINKIMMVLILSLLAYSRGCDVEDDWQPSDSKQKEHVSHLYPVTVDGKFGFINQSGQLVISLPDDIYSVRPFSEGLAAIAKRVPNTYGKWGFIDESGNVAIRPVFNNAKPFSEGLAAVIVGETKGVIGKVGYIDKTGQFVIQPQFDTGGVESDYAFSNGLAAVFGQNGKWGYIDKTGKFVIEPEFSAAFPFSEGRALVQLSDRKYSSEDLWGYINTSGGAIVPPTFGNAGGFSESLAPAEFDKQKVGYISRQGELTIRPMFDAGSQCPHTRGTLTERGFYEGLAAVKLGGKWGFIDKSGHLAIKPAFDCAERFNQGMALVGVRKDVRWQFGYIDKTGTVIIEPQFTAARMFSGDLALVGVGLTDDEVALKTLTDAKAGKSESDIEKEIKSSEMKYGYIDRSGKFVWKPTN